MKQKKCCVCGKVLPPGTHAGGEFIKGGKSTPLYFCCSDCFFRSIFDPYSQRYINGAEK